LLLRLIIIILSMTDQNVIVPIGKISFVASGSLFIIDDSYEFLKVLSRVWRGPTIKARDKNDNSFVVITKIPNLFSNLFDTCTIIKLLKLSRFLRHDNILSYKTLLLPPSRTGFQELYTVEPCMDTTLHAVIQSKQTLSEEHVQYLMYQILLGLHFLHSAGVIHCNLAPNCILVNSDCSVKIALCEESREVHHEPDMEEYVRNRWYTSPERLASLNKISYENDVWSAGCIMAEIIGRKPLFTGHDVQSCFRDFIRVLGSPSEEDMDYLSSERARAFIRSLNHFPTVNWNSIFPQASNECLDLLDKMLKFKPNRRLKAEECLKHPFFQSLFNPSDIISSRQKFDWSFEDLARDVSTYENIIYEECLEHISL
jgi:serine/threonine protein kinase